jgi:lysine 6-dehydrogenase
VKVGDTELSPLEMSWVVLGRKLSEGDPHDVTVMRVIARSRTGEFVYDMADKYDDREKVTSMGKTTGYTASIVAQMVGSGRIKGKGTLPPERAVEGPLVETLLSELRRKGVSIIATRHALPQV